MSDPECAACFASANAAGFSACTLVRRITFCTYPIQSSPYCRAHEAVKRFAQFRRFRSRPRRLMRTELRTELRLKLLLSRKPSLHSDRGQGKVKTASIQASYPASRRRRRFEGSNGDLASVEVQMDSSSNLANGRGTARRRAGRRTAAMTESRSSWVMWSKSLSVVRACSAHAWAFCASFASDVGTAACSRARRSGACWRGGAMAGH